MDKVLTVDFITDEDRWGITTSEKIQGRSENGTEIVFYAYDLSECPEDATFGRDLFSGYDFIDAIKLGMKLAQEGYTDINCNYLKAEEDDDDDE